MKKFLKIFTCIALLGAFAGCSDDDDDAIDQALLVGSWQETSVYDGQTDEWYTESDVLVLYEDGTGYQALSFTSKPDRFNWHCEGNILVKDFGGPYEDISEAIVEKVSDTELVLAQEYEGEDGRTYRDRALYERAK